MNAEMTELLRVQAERQKNTIIHGEIQPGKELKQVEKPAIVYANKIAAIREAGGMTADMPQTSSESCPTCHGSGFFRQDGLPIDDPQFGKAVPCSDVFHYQERIARQSLYSEMIESDYDLDLHDIPEHFNDVELVSLPYITKQIPQSNRAMLKRFKEIAESPFENAMTLVSGPNGNGKSTAAKALVNELNKKGLGVATYVTLGGVFDHIKQAFSKNSTEDMLTRFNRIKHAKFLVIDEFELSNGKVQETEFNIQKLSELVDARWLRGCDKSAVTIIISNDNPKTISSDMGHLASRLNDVRWHWLVCSAPDFRQTEPTY